MLPGFTFGLPLLGLAVAAVSSSCPHRHDRKKRWDMARPEQVLVLEPQHELKFRGNAGEEGWVAVYSADL